MKIDLNAAAIPGKSAAGIELGAHINEFLALFSNSKLWSRECQIQEAIDDEEYWLHVPTLKPGLPDRIEDDYYYSRGALRLGFDKDGILVLIVLAESYTGKLFSEVTVGDRLDKILMHANLEYDDVDELHHASINGREIGLSIYAAEDSLFSCPDQRIFRIFIHNDFL